MGRTCKLDEYGLFVRLMKRRDFSNGMTGNNKQANGEMMHIECVACCYINNIPKMSKHLCYIYIYKYRKLHDVEVVLDHRFKFSMDRQCMSLAIEKNGRSLPDSFWGSNIWSLTGIFGENASGKTSIIRFILDVVVEGQNNKDVDGIIVYEQDGKLYVYHNDLSLIHI